MASQNTFREQIVDKFRAAFEEPEISTVDAGNIYRWTLERGFQGVCMYVSLTCPDYEDTVYVMISDSTAIQGKAVELLTIDSLDQADRMIRRINIQWQTPTPSPSKRP